jgi:hypothetical protein
MRTGTSFGIGTIASFVFWGAVGAVSSVDVCVCATSGAVSLLGLTEHMSAKNGKMQW